MAQISFYVAGATGNGEIKFTASTVTRKSSSFESRLSSIEEKHLDKIKISEVAFENVSFTPVSGYYVYVSSGSASNIDGTVRDASNCEYTTVNVDAGDAIMVTGWVKVNYPIVSFFSDYKINHANYMGAYERPTANKTYTNEVVIVPHGCVMVAVNFCDPEHETCTIKKSYATKFIDQLWTAGLVNSNEVKGIVDSKTIASNEVIGIKSVQSLEFTVPSNRTYLGDNNTITPFSCKPKDKIIIEIGGDAITQSTTGALYLTKYGEQSDQYVDSISPLNKHIFESSFAAEEIAFSLNYLTSGGKVKINVTVVSDVDLPAYYLEYMNGKIERINNVAMNAAGNGDAFVFITDEHWEKNQRRSPQLIKLLNKNCHFDRVFSGGDTADKISPALCDKLREGFEHTIHHVAGNHDWFTPTTGSMMYYYMDTYNDNQIGNPGQHYYYVDNPQQKIRYIVLNSFINQAEIGESGTTVISGYTADQCEWFENEALDVSNSWDVIVFAHWFGTKTNMLSGCSEIRTAIDAFNADQSRTGKVLLVIQGHSHYDALFNTTSGLPILTTTCDKNGAWISGGTDMEPWLTSQRETGTINEQAFDFCVLNREDKTLTAIRIGAKAMKNYAEETSQSFASTDLLDERIVHYESVPVQTTAELTASITGAITWETSDSSVATVSNGVVTKVSSGSCVVSALNDSDVYEAWIIVS